MLLHEEGDAEEDAGARGPSEAAVVGPGHQEQHGGEHREHDEVLGIGREPEDGRAEGEQGVRRRRADGRVGIEHPASHGIEQQDRQQIHGEQADANRDDALAECREDRGIA